MKVGASCMHQSIRVVLDSGGGRGRGPAEPGGGGGCSRGQGVAKSEAGAGAGVGVYLSTYKSQSQPDRSIGDRSYRYLLSTYTLYAVLEA
jgi:hypothetical protein